MRSCSIAASPSQSALASSNAFASATDISSSSVTDALSWNQSASGVPVIAEAYAAAGTATLPPDTTAASYAPASMPQSAGLNVIFLDWKYSATPSAGTNTALPSMTVCIALLKASGDRTLTLDAAAFLSIALSSSAASPARFASDVVFSQSRPIATISTGAVVNSASPSMMISFQFSLPSTAA